MDYKSKVSLYDRILETINIRKKYPNKIPIICERCKITNNDCPNINKNKYLVSPDLTVGQFLYVIRQKIKLHKEKALFIFVNGCIPSTSSQMNQIYNKHKDVDNYLYITYSTEHVFG